MTLQGDYAAQMLGLNTDHMSSSEIMHHTQMLQHQQQSDANLKRSSSRDASPSLRQTQVCYYVYHMFNSRNFSYFFAYNYVN